MESIIPIGYWIFFIFSIVGTLVGLYKLFEKAGEAGWKALVPFYNAYICVKITGKKMSWFIMLMIPVLNVVVWLLMANEISKVFGKDSFWGYVGSMMIPYIYFLKLGFDKDVKYIGPHESAKKSAAREWGDAIAFAVVAATLIRTFFFEAYTIPTTSMESTLKAGDFLFVSKFHYGARFPITPLAFPFAHHTMPLIGTKAYSDKVQLPYMRFPGIEKIHRNIEKSIIQNICQRFRLSWPTDPHVLAIVDICDRFSSQIYFDRETRSGNTHFNVPNSSMEVVRDFYQKDYPEIFQELDNLWLEYVSSL